MGKRSKHAGLEFIKGEPANLGKLIASVAPGMRVRTYKVLARAVGEGAAYGVARAFKHTDSPEREAVKAAVIDAVQAAICDVFEFEE